ncbi:DUF3748 domain-containing protein [Sphingobacterium sp. SGR-19]|uniref:DUF3748 domain-containing protein n=1 Tax=Sphingobacterium sp. SGR-19 TaxID=2710886 RepID=UPI0013ECF091|nr:DUF3748 domain-containing protein [Sphingobacterium sp. SGR-19]NGM65664.1 DUF3748 domain-containing protein [Sphingobacterium sp. SGR-19]
MNIKNRIIEDKAVNNLTTSPNGHTLHHHGVFSKDGKWIVFDGRNDDTKIGETSTIGIVHVETGEERIIYKTANQTIYGPGVGAVSFSPVEDQVIFIHGLPDANEECPYAMSRRTGMLVNIHQEGPAFSADARDVSTPYVPGSLRGGTHSHCWSPDGMMLSFTYNDELVEPDLRVVGVMLKSEADIIVDKGSGNSNGRYYSAIVSDVVANPVPGSDEINKAFDECWVSPATDGTTDHYAIAFQGNTISANGQLVTEIFVVEIDREKILADKAAVGKEGERPKVPQGIRQRRLTYGANLSDLRHWLRSSHDGKYIYALAKDEQGNNQIVRCEVNSGELTFVTDNPFSISSPFNLSKESKKITFVAENNVFVHDMKSNKYIQITQNDLNDRKVVGAPSFSPDGSFVVYNQYEHIEGEEYLQIKRVSIANNVSPNSTKHFPRNSLS